MFKQSPCPQRPVLPAASSHVLTLGTQRGRSDRGEPWHGPAQRREGVLGAGEQENSQGRPLCCIVRRAGSASPARGGMLGPGASLHGGAGGGELSQLRELCNIWYSEQDGSFCVRLLFLSLSRTVPDIVTYDITRRTFLTLYFSSTRPLRDCTVQPLLLTQTLSEAVPFHIHRMSVEERLSAFKEAPREHSLPSGLSWNRYVCACTNVHIHTYTHMHTHTPQLPGRAHVIYVCVSQSLQSEISSSRLVLKSLLSSEVLIHDEVCATKLT